MTHDELVQAARKWLAKPYASCCREHGHAGCSVIVTELESANKTGEIPDALVFQGCRPNYTLLVECKTSYSDFLADQKKVFRSPLMPEDGLGMQRWYLAEPGVIPAGKLPEKWGLLEISAGGINVVKRCVPF